MNWVVLKEIINRRGQSYQSYDDGCVDLIREKNGVRILTSCMGTTWHIINETFRSNKCWQKGVFRRLTQHSEVNMLSLLYTSCVLCLITNCRLSPVPQVRSGSSWCQDTRQLEEYQRFLLGELRTTAVTLCCRARVHLTFSSNPWNVVLEDGHRVPVSFTGHTCCVSSFLLCFFLFDRHCFYFKSLNSLQLPSSTIKKMRNDGSSHPDTFRWSETACLV